jgi:colicin import membrane protein
LSTVRTQRAQRLQPDESDPFFYGWRDIHVQRADGTEDIDQVPLTLEDVLHPEVGDHIVNSTEHADDVIYLREVSGAQLIDDPHAAVLFDCGVDFNLPRTKHLCPDIAVFFGIARRRGWRMFNIKTERAKCVLVIEVTSDSTRKNDFGKKFKYYYRAGVAMYVIVNEFMENKTHRRLELIGYRHAPSRYEKIPLSADGRIWLEALGVWLGVSPQSPTGGDRVACFDAVTNQEIADYAGIRRARDLADERATKAQQKAASAEAKAASAEAKLARARKKATAESQARMAAEARIRELEASLKRSKPNS